MHSHSTDDLRLLSKLLDQALDLPESARADWLACLLGDAARLRGALQSLLSQRSSVEIGDWLSQGPAFTVHDQAIDGRASTFEEGQIVAGYRLLRELGHGGMGEVWLAERIDGQLKRQVALKLPMLGPRRAQLVERFARERDILASLEHPHIARLYDAGVSEDGQPYMALEYVQGNTLTAYCDEKRLNVEQRLALFMQVLDAVEYAHARLVIHRDLKPSNIFVGNDDQVRLLDFGVAKLLAGSESSPAGADPAALTDWGGQVFTPSYASPEQVRGDTLGTASDVYSLGVVLFELLCGQRPYALRFDGRAQLEQAIVEAEPLPPSGCVDAASAERRGTTVAKLRRELRGELDTIVLKALKKVATARYATVAQLAEDLRRHRDGEPVLAQPDTWAYRTAKLLRRHKAITGGVIATMLALVLGLGVALWESHLAQQQRDRALRMVERSNGVDEFVSDLLLNAARGGKGVSTKDLLDRSVAYVDAAYGQDRALQADLLMFIANIKSSLDGPMAGLPFLDRVQGLLTPQSEWNQVLRLRCTRLYPDLLGGKIKLTDAKATVEAILANPETTPDEGAICLYQLAVVQTTMGDRTSAVETCRRALAMLGRSSLANAKERNAISVLLASALSMTGHTREGEALFLAAEREYERLHVERSYSGYVLRGNWATMALQGGRPRQTMELIERNLTWFREDRPSEAPSPIFVYTRLAAAAELGRYESALEGIHELKVVSEAAHEDRMMFAAHAVTAAVEAQLGHLEAAERAFEAAAAMKSPMLIPGHFGPILLQQTRAAIDLKAGRYAAVIKTVQTLLTDPALSLAQRQQALLIRALAEVGSGDGKAALTDAEGAVALGHQLQGDLPDSSRTGRALLALAKAQHQLGQDELARKSLVEAERQLSHTVDEIHPALIESRSMLKAMDTKG